MSNRTLLWVAGAALVLLSVVWLGTHHREYEIFPGPLQDSLQIYHYQDQSEGGQSIANVQIADSTLHFGFRLASGAAFPYAGCGLILTTDAQMLLGQFMNLKGYDSLRMEIRSNRSNQVRLQLLTHDPNLTRPEDPLSKRFFIQSIPLQRSYQVVRIPMSNFQAPEWWFDHHGMQPDYGLKYMDRVTNFEISSGIGTLLGIPDTVEVRSIVFYGENHTVNQTVLVLVILIIAGVVARLWLGHTRRSIVQKTQIQVRKEEMLKGYEKLPVQSHRSQDLQRAVDYLHNNYSDAELSLESICRETGLNRNRLSELLKNEVGSTFKTYLNEVRLTEAARVLAETDLQVTEVAYKVGFGNVSHFNRIFKEKFNVTPLEYRRAHAK